MIRLPLRSYICWDVKKILSNFYIAHKLLFGVLIISAFTGCCGYQFDCQKGLPATYNTIYVPYVEGDEDGTLTAALITSITQSGCFRYKNSCAASLSLRVKIVDLRDENIGFRYDRKKKGQLTRSIIPTETRASIFVEVIVEENLTGKIVLGPVKLSSSVDYDHDYYAGGGGANVFSLGQLCDVDEANEAAKQPLYRLLAQKIVDYVTQSW